MSKSVLLSKKEELATKVTRSEDLRGILERECRSFTDGERTESQNLVNEIRNLQSEIKDLQNLEDVSRMAHVGGDGQNQRSFSNGDNKDFNKFSFTRAVRSAMGNLQGSKDDAGLEIEMNQEFQSEARSLGIQFGGNRNTGIPFVMMKYLAKRNYEQMVGEQRSMSVSGANSSTANASLVKVDYDPNIITLFRKANVLRSLGVRLETGLTANKEFTKEETMLTANWQGENTAMVNADKTFSASQLAPKRVTARTARTTQLLLQSNWDIDNMLFNELLERSDSKLNEVYFFGSGAGDVPAGLFVVAGTQTLAINTNGGELTKGLVGEFSALIDDIDAMDENMAYVSNSRVRHKLRNTKLDAGSGLFLMDRKDELDGYRFLETNHIPRNLTKGSGTGLSAMAFGNFRESYIGQWGGMEIQADPFTEGDSSTTILRLHSFWNFKFLKPNSFVVCKDIVTTL